MTAQDYQPPPVTAPRSLRTLRAMLAEIEEVANGLDPEADALASLDIGKAIDAATVELARRVVAPLHTARLAVTKRREQHRVNYEE